MIEEQKLTLKVPEAAKLLRVSPKSCYRAVREGTIPAIHFGRVIRIPRYALEEILGKDGDSHDSTGD